MPKRTDIQHIMVLGAGPIVIGQACEFDYSGSQAIKSLRSLGYRVTLVNSNPATIMTDPNLADATYVEPLTPRFVASIIEKERPDALLPTMGGQTALNIAMDLHRSGVLSRHGVELIGARADVIDRAEDRQRFRTVAQGIGLDMPQAFLADNLQEALGVRRHLELPIILRPSYTLGGGGGSVVHNQEEFESLVRKALEVSPVGQVLLEESVMGWKEFEIEVVRDVGDNCIVVCSIENIDPMGVHTGDSITVAPALTLTDKEYQKMRDASFALVRAIGVETGGCNVQFAVNPADGRMVVIEVNPRVSRSSALASKATGFPIAKVAAQLAVGLTLDEIRNDITATTPASFEPTLDYIVLKIPRFDFQKFPDATNHLTTSMQSVGETMAMARSFKEVLQKALYSLETGLEGLESPPELAGDAVIDDDALRARITRPSDRRLLWIAQAMRQGWDIDFIHQACGIDPWFLDQIQQLVETEEKLRCEGLPASTDTLAWTKLKVDGFLNERLAFITRESLSEVESRIEQAGVRSSFKRVDTCAAEFASRTPYLYSTYEWSGAFDQRHDGACGGQDEADPSDHPRKVVVLGSGPNRIGQGIEFDYCCVHAVSRLRELGCEAVMINCNPETVSTDYDTADRLYFEPLIFERVQDILRRESERGQLLGVVAQFGGQTPLKLAARLEEAGYFILGTKPSSIDAAEDRGRFAAMLAELEIPQPLSVAVTSREKALAEAKRLRFPLMLRPSYVLGGRAMEVVYNSEFLLKAFDRALALCAPNPVLIDQFLSNAVEVDVDAVCGENDVFVAGIIEHVEQAGIHSGDSAGVLPPVSLTPEVIATIKRYTEQLARALGVVGLLNVQYAVKEGKVYVLEANPRASRTVPFVAKATGVPLARYAVDAMLGEPLPVQDLKSQFLHAQQYFAVKEAVFPFTRLVGCSDAALGPEMQSTGEVIGMDSTYAGAFAKAQIAAGSDLPLSGTALISVCDSDKEACISLAQSLLEMGFGLVATNGTAQFLHKAGLASIRVVNKVMEGSPHCVDAILNRQVNLIINTTQGVQSRRDSASIRMTALKVGIPYATTMAGAHAMVQAIQALIKGKIVTRSLQDYHSRDGGAPITG